MLAVVVQGAVGGDIGRDDEKEGGVLINGRCYRRSNSNV
jgi:hypothetical protein